MWSNDLFFLPEAYFISGNADKVPCRETQSYIYIYIFFFFLKIRSSVIRSHLSGHRQTLAAQGERAIGGELKAFFSPTCWLSSGEGTLLQGTRRRLGVKS